jgi:hypothetical protein
MSAKQKQIAKVCIVAGIALLIIVLGMTLTGKKPEKKEEEQKKDRKFSILSEKVIAKEIEQRRPGLDVYPLERAVDLERDPAFRGRCFQTRLDLRIAIHAHSLFALLYGKNRAAMTATIEPIAETALHAAFAHRTPTPGSVGD